MPRRPLTDNQLQTISADILPEIPSVINIGSSVAEFNNAYFDGTTYADVLKAEQEFHNEGPEYLEKIVEKDANYTATIYDRVIKGDTSGGAFTITLPAASTATGLVLTFIRTGAGVNALTIDGNGAETIDGAATNAEMDAQYDSITIICDGTEWFIIAHKIA